MVPQCEHCRQGFRSVVGSPIEVYCDECGWNGRYCERDKCKECCPHDERDHGICLDCGDEEDPGDAIDRAMMSMED